MTSILTSEVIWSKEVNFYHYSNRTNLNKFQGTLFDLSISWPQTWPLRLSEVMGTKIVNFHHFSNRTDLYKFQWTPLDFSISWPQTWPLKSLRPKIYIFAIFQAWVIRATFVVITKCSNLLTSNLTSEVNWGIRGQKWQILSLFISN